MEYKCYSAKFMYVFYMHHQDFPQSYATSLAYFHLVNTVEQMKVHD